MKIKPFLVLPGILGTALAMGTTDPAVTAKAGLLLKEADAKLASAKTLKAVYTEADEYPGEYKDLRQIGTLTISKPGNIRLEIVRARRVKAADPWKNSGNTTLRVSDGKTSYSVFFHAKSTQVRTQDAPDELRLEEAPLLAGFLGSARTPSKAFEEASRNGDITEVEATNSHVEFKAGPLTRTIELGSDGLIHKLVVRNDTTHATKTWTLDSVTLNPTVSTSAFQYATPKNAIPYPAGERTAGIPIGTSAPDFEDPNSSNKPIHLSDYKGKVVVLEFWATWCWPCNQSIPETQRLVTKYADKGVESLLVSIKDNRQGFDAWIAKHPQYRNLKFAYDDPTHGNAYEAFNHPTNPTLYVIGRDGSVLFKTEGYTGSNPAVEKAIQAAL